MKKYFLAILVVMQFATAGNDNPFPGIGYRFKPENIRLVDDCDACGCSASGGSMGFSSMLSNRYVGVRYMYQRYDSRDGIFANSPTAKEHFNTWQIWAKVPVTDKISVIALVPYHAHLRERVSGNENISGFGDVTVLTYYSIFKTKKDSVNWKHSVQAGAGIKAPTGTYDQANNLGSVNPSFQIGTGSWDYTLAAEYVINYKQSGLQLMTNYTFKNENENKYRFGDQLNYGATYFRMYELPNFKMMPQAGVVGEVYADNTQYGVKVTRTGGDVLFGKLGLEAGYRKIGFGVSALMPVSQNLNSGWVEAKTRWSLNLNYSF